MQWDLSEAERAIKATVNRFEEEVVRPAGIALDQLAPEAAIDKK